jgi:hypothetical protein
VFDDVMVRLVSAIEAKARAKLAHRLVAAPVLRLPERLDERASSPTPGARASGTSSQSLSADC